jgi:hypothetical protein
MVLQQAREAALARLPRQSEILTRAASPAGARHGDVLGEHIRAAALDLHAEIEGEPVAVAAQRHGLRRYAVRQCDARRHGHRRSLLRATVEPQGKRAAVALAREDLGVARVTDGLAVRGCRRQRLERQAACRDRLLHLRSAHLAEWKARLVLRPEHECERQLHRAVIFGRHPELHRGQVRRGLTHEARHLDRRFPATVLEAVAARERRAAQVERLVVVLEMPRVEWRAVEPRAAGVRAEVRLRPARNRRRP